MTREEFSAVLRRSSTGPLLDRWLAEDAILAGKAETPSGPRECCADFASVIRCDGETDVWRCEFCGLEWIAPCR